MGPDSPSGEEANAPTGSTGPDSLVRWRAQHGGRGIPVPEALWAGAVEVARVEGFEATTRDLWLTTCGWRSARSIRTCADRGITEPQLDAGGTGRRSDSSSRLRTAVNLLLQRIRPA